MAIRRHVPHSVFTADGREKRISSTRADYSSDDDEPIRVVELLSIKHKTAFKSSRVTDLQYRRRWNFLQVSQSNEKDDIAPT